MSAALPPSNRSLINTRWVLPGALDLFLAVGERRVDVGAAAELHTEQHLDRIGELVGQVEDRGVEAHELRLDHRQRGHDGGKDR
jgi:hypothetical protein